MLPGILFVTKEKKLFQLKSVLSPSLHLVLFRMIYGAFWATHRYLYLSYFSFVVVDNIHSASSSITMETEQPQSQHLSMDDVMGTLRSMFQGVDDAVLQTVLEANGKREVITLFSFRLQKKKEKKRKTNGRVNLVPHNTCRRASRKHNRSASTNTGLKQWRFSRR